MRKSLLLLVSLSLAFLLWFPAPPGPALAGGVGSAWAADRPVAVGEPAPDLRIRGLDGEEYHLAGLRGKKVVLLTLWAVWCPPCIEEIPRLNDLHGRYASRGLAVLGLAVPQGQDEKTVRRFLGKTEMRYPVLFDGEDQASTRYGALFVPQNYLIGADGVVAYKGTVLPEDLEERIQGLLAAIPAGAGPATAAPDG